MSDPVSSPRTGPHVEALVSAVRHDLEAIRTQLAGALDGMRQLEAVSKGVNGLAPYLKGQGNAVSQMIEGIEAEAEAVERKMLGTGRPEISERVDGGKLAEVVAAKGAQP